MRVVDVYDDFRGSFVPECEEDHRIDTTAELIAAVLALSDERSTLGLVETAPDPVRLTDRERMIQALRSHRALGADRLGDRLPAHPPVVRLGMIGRKEEPGVDSLARSSPVPTGPARPGVS